MRLSCNGCRVLRKGCSEDCTIRSCLQWIKTAEGQANATIFLAKFYGRAGLLNLINSGPHEQRSAIFRSLLYEACGRVVNPIYGSVGLLWNGSWHLCQAAVEAVLKGEPIARMPSNSLAAASTPVPLLKSCDIRHISKESRPSHNSTALHKVIRKRRRYKRSASAAKLSWTGAYPMHCERAPSHESVNHAQGLIVDKEGDGRKNESVLSVETVEVSHVSQTEPEGEVELKLTLGLQLMAQHR